MSMFEFQRETIHLAAQYIIDEISGDQKLTDALTEMIYGAVKSIECAVAIIEHTQTTTPAVTEVPKTRKKRVNKKKDKPKDTPETPNPSVQTCGELGIKDLENAGKE